MLMRCLKPTCALHSIHFITASAAGVAGDVPLPPDFPPPSRAPPIDAFRSRRPAPCRRLVPRPRGRLRRLDLSARGHAGVGRARAAGVHGRRRGARGPLRGARRRRRARRPHRRAGRRREADLEQRRRLRRHLRLRHDGHQPARVPDRHHRRRERRRQRHPALLLRRRPHHRRHRRGDGGERRRGGDLHRHRPAVLPLFRRAGAGRHHRRAPVEAALRPRGANLQLHAVHQHASAAGRRHGLSPDPRPHGEHRLLRQRAGGREGRLRARLHPGR